MFHLVESEKSFHSKCRLGSSRSPTIQSMARVEQQETNRTGTHQVPRQPRICPRQHQQQRY